MRGQEEGEGAGEGSGVKWGGAGGRGVDTDQDSQCGPPISLVHTLSSQTYSISFPWLLTVCFKWSQ